MTTSSCCGSRKPAGGGRGDFPKMGQAGASLKRELQLMAAVASCVVTHAAQKREQTPTRSAQRFALATPKSRVASAKEPKNDLERLLDVVAGSILPRRPSACASAPRDDEKREEQRACRRHRRRRADGDRAATSGRGLRRRARSCACCRRCALTCRRCGRRRRGARGATRQCARAARCGRSNAACARARTRSDRATRAADSRIPCSLRARHGSAVLAIVVEDVLDVVVRHVHVIVGA
jgi:hypothetical protein